MNISVSLTLVLWMLGYTTAILSAGALALWMQRRFFLHQDEDQSFVLPGIAGFGVGIMYLAVAMIHV